MKGFAGRRRGARQGLCLSMDSKCHSELLVHLGSAYKALGGKRRHVVLFVKDGPKYHGRGGHLGVFYNRDLFDIFAGPPFARLFAPLVPVDVHIIRE